MRIESESLPALDGSKASLEAYILDNTGMIDLNRRRPAVIIAPGGGFLTCSDREAEPIAVKLMSFGYQAFVLRYSLVPSVYPTALNEMAQAVRLVRHNAERWNVDPQAIVIAGFSAGGHVAADLAVEWNGELLESQGLRPEEIHPNGLLLGYPVISAGQYAHKPTFEHLLGERVNDEALRRHLSLETRDVTQVPPTFIWHTFTDTVVPVENSIHFIAALHQAGVEVEAHLYPQGPHSCSLGTMETQKPDGAGVELSVQSWIELFRKWMHRHFGSFGTLNH